MLAKVTGSTDTPIQDGTARGALLTILWVPINLIARKTDWLTSEDIADISLVMPFVALFLLGLWDRYVKPRLAQ